MTSILEPFESKRHPNETGTSSIYASPNNSGARILITTSEGIEKVTVALENLTNQVQENTTKTNSNEINIKENKTEINSLDSRLTTVEDTLDTTVETAITSLQSNVSNNTTNITNLTTRVTNNETAISQLQSASLLINVLNTNTPNTVQTKAGGIRLTFIPLLSTELTKASTYIISTPCSKFLHISGNIGGLPTSTTPNTYIIAPFINASQTVSIVDNRQFGFLNGSGYILTPRAFTTTASSFSFSFTITLPVKGLRSDLNSSYNVSASSPTLINTISTLALGINSPQEITIPPSSTMGQNYTLIDFVYQ